MNQISNIIRGTVSDLSEHPGYLEMGSIIHADWPAYPRGIGWKSALKSLVSYPIGMKFYPIDDIDKCLLFVNNNPATIKNGFDEEKLYHIALWHEDISELKKMGLVDGSVAINEYEWMLDRYNKLKEAAPTLENADGNVILSTKNEDGGIRTHLYRKPTIEDFDIGINGWVRVEKCIEVTPLGETESAKLEALYPISEEIKRVTAPLLGIGKNDTAIREAVLLIETKLRNSLNSTNFGMKLIEEHINDVVKKNDFNRSALIKGYRAELRCLFKYIRNEYMHNFKEISSVQTNMILSKIQDVYGELLEVLSVYK